MQQPQRHNYDPTTGTFLTRDPLPGINGTADVANPYSYVHNDPLNQVDPMGLRSTDEPGLTECKNKGGEVWDVTTGACGKLVPGSKGSPVDCATGALRAVVDFVWTQTLPGRVMEFKELTEARFNNGMKLNVIDLVPIAGSVNGAANAESYEEFCGQITRLTMEVYGVYAAGNAKMIPKLRQAYMDDFRLLHEEVAHWQQAGASSEFIAREASANRRALGIKYKNLTPEPLRSRIRERNILRYQDEWGPTIDYHLKKGRSWEEIIEKSLSPGGSDFGW